jgi:hypothetical protein
MRKFNHLMTYESFKANEEFNPLKKKDWKSVGHTVRKRAGFLTPEEEIEAGKKIVLTHPVKKQIYDIYLNGGDFKGKHYEANPKKAQEYLKFWAKNPEGHPVWDVDKFVDKAIYSAPGSTGASN